MKYPLLSIDKLRWGYAGSWQAGPLSAEIREGTIIVILGPNGSGKTTLLKTILGLRPPLGGRISIGGHSIQELSIRERARLCSWVPQFFDPLWDFTVWDLVSQGRYAYSTGFHSLTKEDRECIHNTLTELDLTHLQSKRFSSLSGGQARQVLIARAVCQDTPLILLDEPAANLDPGKQLELGELLQRLAAKGKTICISLHDINLAYRLAHKVILLFHDGSAAWGAPEEILIPFLLEKAYNTTFVHGYHEEYGKFSLPSRRKKKGGRL
ncbi:ABC transporter ATP-binding protein [Treponema sp. J25]|jgi:iron complex transport system ATP-binding protein|uniref:ABC transporter ATP-binding protein n=1 Tax=Treponema sp. J25 TaxID=2094121 RepID=UPI0010459D8B|nr:ABC transporter ATP-binding protein [Treponema sp. J25]TCW61527.1 ABC transporter [Treponema sp. J25]